MASIRAQVILQGGSDLPEDRYINTFHFSNDSGYGPHSLLVIQAMTAFYGNPGTLPEPFDALGSLTPPYVKRSYEVRTYDMTEPKPRVPTIAVATLPTVKSGNTGLLPHEVACVLSFHGEPPVTARKRGRIYFGPLGSVGIQAGGTTATPKISDNIRGALIGAAVRLKDAGVGWCIYSPTNNAYVPVVGGWVDNEFDTVRGRGGEATSRQTWD